jgi:hypothetical protein
VRGLMHTNVATQHDSRKARVKQGEQSYADGAEDLVKQFFVTLQRDISDWIWLGTTKTGIVCHLNGSSRKGHE